MPPRDEHLDEEAEGRPPAQAPEAGRGRSRATQAGSGRRAGPLEALYQEFVRRAASIGLSGVALTEEAVRKAMSESAHKEWVEFISRQGGDFRRELIDALVREFAAWLRDVDLDGVQRRVLQQVLEDFELSFEVKVSARPRGDRDAADPDPDRGLELVKRRP